jgi:hypothetical protein
MSMVTFENLMGKCEQTLTCRKAVIGIALIDSVHQRCLSHSFQKSQR